jgi:hypothetical protein
MRSGIEEVNSPLVLSVVAADIGLAFGGLHHDGDAVKCLMPRVKDVSRHDAA